MLHLKEEGAEEIIGCNFDFSRRNYEIQSFKNSLLKEKACQDHKALANISLILLGWVKPRLGKFVLHILPIVSVRPDTLHLLA